MFSVVRKKRKGGGWVVAGMEIWRCVVMVVLDRSWGW
jgi:hypothetical protein